jgi:hypothetical protein
MWPGVAGSVHERLLVSPIVVVYRSIDTAPREISITTATMSAYPGGGDGDDAYTRRLGQARAGSGRRRNLSSQAGPGLTGRPLNAPYLTFAGAYCYSWNSPSWQTEFANELRKAEMLQ